MKAEDLVRAVRDAEPENLPVLVGALAQAQAVALARLAVRTPEAQPPINDRLLTFGEAAELLGTSENYVEVLARQRKIPTVRLPGLDRGGRARAGKQVRIRVEDLREVVSLWTDEGVDGLAYATYSSGRDGSGGSADPQRARPHAAPVGRTTRRGRKFGGSMGARRDGDEVDSGEAPAAVGRRGEG
jgi:excisionase family DNA binding protein